MKTLQTSRSGANESGNGPTIAQIAAEAGVSIGTVSRVLNGKNKNGWASAAANAKKIHQIARRLNYRPSWAARAMANRKSHMIGVVIRNAPDRKFVFLQSFETIVGINDQLAESDYMMSLVHLHELADVDGEIPRMFRENIMDAMIVLGGEIPDQVEQLLREIQSEVVPCLWVENNEWRPNGCLHRDETAAAQLVVQRLVASGYRRLIWLGPDAHASAHYSAHEREIGVRKMAEAMDVPVTWCHVSDEPYQEMLSFCKQQQLTPDTAIIASGTRHAMTLVSAANQAGGLVGRDFGLACCDDSQQVSVTFPNLSRVSFDRYEMGRVAASMLLGGIEGQTQDVSSQRLSGHWIPGTTAPGYKPGLSTSD